VIKPQKEALRLTLQPFVIFCLDFPQIACVTAFLANLEFLTNRESHLGMRQVG
jgi:hypothetical protein